jgi:hypothetical protein
MMAEPTRHAIRRAQEIVTAALRLDDAVRQGLITAIALDLDDLALPLQALLEGVRNGESGDSEIFRARVAAASVALWGFQGHPPGRLP